MQFGLVDWWIASPKTKSKMDWEIGNQYIFQDGLGTGTVSIQNGLVHTLHVMICSHFDDFMEKYEKDTRKVSYRASFSISF